MRASREPRHTIGESSQLVERPTSSRRKAGTALAALVLLAAGTGCTSDKVTGVSAAPQEQETEVSGLADIDEYLPQAGLERLVSESDLVVRGRVVQAEEGAPIAKDPTAAYTVFTIRVDEVIHGKEVETANVASLTESGGAPVQIEGRPAVRVGDDAIWLLTEIAPDFNYEGYVLTNQSSLLVVGDDGTVRGGSESSLVREEIERLRNVKDVLSYLRSVSAWRT